MYVKYIMWYRYTFSGAESDEQRRGHSFRHVVEGIERFSAETKPSTGKALVYFSPDRFAGYTVKKQ